MRVRMSSFDFDGHRLVYDAYGGGNRLVVLMPGLLVSRLMHRQLAEALGVEAALVGGTSLGANASLEMPVLDNALLGCALAFTPLLVGLTSAPPSRARAQPGQAVCREVSQLADVALDSVSQDPKPSASVLQGLFFGRVAPLARRGGAGARAAERPPSGGVLDPRAASGAGAPDRGDRRLHARLLSREATPPGAGGGAPQRPAEAPLAAAEGSH